MTSKEIGLGEFQEFSEGVLIAEINGLAMRNACRLLGRKPPFNDPLEADRLIFNDQVAARQKTIKYSGVIELVARAGELDPEIDTVLVSKTGALAIKSDNKELLDEAQLMIQELDNDNFSVFLYPFIEYMQ